MTDRYNALIVTLDQDYRSDDAEAIISAIRQLRGVLSVVPHVARLEDHIAYTKARQELGDRLWNVLHAPEQAR